MKEGTEKSSSAFADLSEEEREKILEVIQRDFSLREQEKKRLEKIEEDVRYEERQKSLLTQRKDFNENFCWCCCRAFGYIFNRRQICIKCRAYVCKSCSSYDTASKGYICVSCIKKDDLKSMSLEWFYTSVSKRFKRFGSAKVVRAFYKKKSASQRNLSDSELESGFMPTFDPSRRSRLPLQEVFDSAIEDGSHTISEVDLTSQLLASRHQSNVSRRQLPRSTSLDVLPKSNLTKTQSLEILNRDSLQRHSVWDLPIRDPSKVLDVNVSKLQKKEVQNGSSTILQTKDIYKEAFENTRKAEEQKFRVKFDSLLDDLQQALDSQTPTGISSIHNSTSYGDIMVSYRKRIRELLSVLSQRLQLAVENYLEEENPANVSQKVKQIVSRLVEDQLGESVDLTSDEAVSDLSSLSDESTEVHQCYEDQLAQAVVSKVIENQRREGMPNPQERVQEILEATNASPGLRQVPPHSPDDTAAQIIADLKSYSKTLPGRKPLKPLQVEEVVLPYEPPIEKKVISRVKTSNQSSSRNLSSPDLADRSRCSLPNLDELDFDSNEIDPDLLSLNLTPIKEVDEEIEDLGAGPSLNWHQNWILRDLNSRKRVEEISQNHPVLVPQPEEVLSPRVGNRDADELSDLSENDELERDAGSSLSGEGELSLSNEDLTEKEPKSLIELFSPVESISATTLTPPIGTSSPVKTSDAEDSYGSLPDKQSTTSQQMPVTSVNPEPVIKSIPSEEGDPKFEVRPESQKNAEGEAVKWQCRVSGTEPIDIFWFRIESEVQELEEDEKYEMTKEDTNKHTLTIHYPSKSEAGQYMCIAVNEKGKCSEYFILNIQDNTQPIKAPEFLKSPQDVEVTEGQMVKFRCKVKGYPPPRITWYKDGKLLKGNSSCKLEKFGNRDYLLTIEYATMEDDAEYSVLAKNIGGESRAMAQLLVEPLEPIESDSICSMRSKLSISSSSRKSSLDQSSAAALSQEKMEEDSSVKKDFHIQNLSRKMTKTKDGVSDVAEELLQSADEMSLIQQHLDFMDHTLNKLEININQDLSKETNNDQDSLNNNDGSQIDDLFAQQVLAEYHVQEPVTRHKSDSEKEVTEEEEEEVVKKDEDAVTIDDETVVDDLFAHRVLAEHRDQKTAAENMRKVTTSALAILQSAEDALAQEQQKDSQNNVILSEEQSLEEEEEENVVCGQHKTNELSSCTDSKMVASEETSLNIGLTPDTEKKRNSLSANENILVGVGCESPVEDNVSNLPVVVETLNFGPKPIDLQRFSRDFYVNSPVGASQNTASTQAASKIKEVVSETEDKIYIAANGVYSLEDKIQQLEAQVENIHEGMCERSMSDLEDEVAKTVAQVKHSEHQVTSLECSVDHLQRATEFLPSLSPRQSVDSGVSSTKEQFHIPRILIGQSSEEEVPESRSEFDTDSGIELPSVTQLKAMFNQPKDDAQGDASVKRIHSITARSLSKVQMEEIQKQRMEGEARKSISLDGRPAERHRPSLKSVPAPLPPGGLSQNKATRRQAPLAPPLRDAEVESEDAAKTPRIKKGCIAARAAFWEKVMQQGGMTEKEEKIEFPELLEENGA